ncbi:MAG TPA: IS200/IS605 family transposase [Candidatus Binatia bacterium]|jgi:putative transposase
MPYWKLYYHLVWATFERLPLITPEREAILRTTLYVKAKELRLVLHGLGNVADHIHVVASIPPVLSVAACVKRLKGASSRAVSLQASAGQVFRWQEGYGALSFGERSLETVAAYVHNQPRHHRERSTLALYETTDEHGIPQSSSDDFRRT